jgi:hypothetical protein
MRRIYGAFGRLLPEEVERFDRDVEALAGVTGFVFLDPEDGVHPVFLAHRVRRMRPDTEVVLPLVSRDANRTALLAVGRAAQALGAAGLLLLAGHLDPANPAKTVYELDPLQMLVLLRRAEIGLEAWVASRCATAAERARVESLAKAGAKKCLVPWDGEEPCPRDMSLAPVFSLGETQWREGGVPPCSCDLLLRLAPGQGEAAAARLALLDGGAP